MLMNDNLADYNFTNQNEDDVDFNPHSINRVTITKTLDTSKYLRNKSAKVIENREYFDPFHPQNHSSSTQLSSPMKGSSSNLDEFSSVAGHYFKDIIIPRVPSRKSRIRRENNHPEDFGEKEYIFQQTSCLPQLKIKTTAVRHRYLPSKRILSANSLTRNQTRISSTSSPALLPSTCPFQKISIPETIELLIFPYSLLMISQAVNDLLGQGQGQAIIIHQNCTFSELKVCIFNGVLCTLLSNQNGGLGKAEYARRLKSFRIWILEHSLPPPSPSPSSSSFAAITGAVPVPGAGDGDGAVSSSPIPSSQSQRWVQLRSQADWDRIKWLIATNSKDSLKVMYDDDAITHSTTMEDVGGDVVGERKDGEGGCGDIDDSLTLTTNPRRDSESVYLDSYDYPPMTGDDKSTGQDRPRLRLLAGLRKSSPRHHSPVKQQKMAQILEQRILLSRI